MAWGSLNTLGSNAEKVNDTSLTLAVAATAEVGNVIVVLVAFNNVGTVDGDNNAIASVADDAGNTYTKARQFENAQGAVNAGAGIAVYFSEVTTQLNSGALITVTFNANNTAKAISAWEFSIGAGSLVSVEAGADLADDGADPSSLDLTTPNAEFLWIRAVAKEGVVGVYTKTAAYSTAFAAAGTSGGGAATNMSVAGEFDIFTGTTNASDPTWTASNADHASVLVALKEAAETITMDKWFREAQQRHIEKVTAVAYGHISTRSDE